MIFLRPFDGLRAQDERRGGPQFAARLADKARRLVEAKVAARSLGARRWRAAALLWPLFAKGS